MFNIVIGNEIEPALFVLPSSERSFDITVESINCVCARCGILATRRCSIGIYVANDGASEAIAESLLKSATTKNYNATYAHLLD
jgi:hypothetical protein